jgi:cell wall-associated NlpC family hydrolase
VVIFVDDKQNNKQKDVEIKDTIGFESQNSSFKVATNQKSGGNNPSDLGTINTNLPNSKSNSETRSNVNRPELPNLNAPSQNTGTLNNSNSNLPKQNRQVNNFGRKNEQNNKDKNINSKGTNNSKENNKSLENNDVKDNKQIKNPKDVNPLLNQNNMKNFGMRKNVKDPKINSSASFLGKGRGFMPGKGKLPLLQGNKLLSSLTKRKEKKKSITENLMEKKAGFGVAEVFTALPIQIKIAIFGGLIAFLVIISMIIVAIMTKTSFEEGNREMLEEFVEGDYTEEQLCRYLVKNGYISENATCEDTNPFKFFVTLKSTIKEYEEEYAINRYKVNTELLYETLFYFSADAEYYDVVTEEEIRNLIDASLEKIEESCVIKTYDSDTKTCTSTKYVYNLYEFSLNKYISYLKYGNSSTHPNYSGKSVTRKCGTGTNTDYVFGYGFVNTSSSPLSEKSSCPNESVTDSDYTNLPSTWTSLEDLNALGGVDEYSHTYKGNNNDSSDTIDDSEIVGSEDGVKIAQYALQFVGNPYVYGGNSLTKGTDCSGFVKLVYAHFNITLNRTTSEQIKQGKTVSCDTATLKAGDLIFYDNPVSHVALYIGNGKVVHAKGAKYGITTDKYDYSKKGFNVCKRIVD